MTVVLNSITQDDVDSVKDIADLLHRRAALQLIAKLPAGGPAGLHRWVVGYGPHLFEVHTGEVLEEWVKISARAVS